MIERRSCSEVRGRGGEEEEGEVGGGWESKERDS